MTPTNRSGVEENDGETITHFELPESNKSDEKEGEVREYITAPIQQEVQGTPIRDPNPCANRKAGKYYRTYPTRCASPARDPTKCEHDTGAFINPSTHVKYSHKHSTWFREMDVRPTRGPIVQIFPREKGAEATDEQHIWF